MATKKNDKKTGVARGATKKSVSKATSKSVRSVVRGHVRKSRTIGKTKQRTYSSFTFVEINDAEKMLRRLYGIKNWEEDSFEAVFGYDPDIVKADGYSTYFVVIPSKKTVVVSELYEENEKLLKIWLTRTSVKGWTTGESWSDFSKAKNAIAYRGGAGYHYAISIYNGNL